MASHSLPTWQQGCQDMDRQVVKGPGEPLWWHIPVWWPTPSFSLSSWMWISTEALFMPRLDHPRPPLTPQEAAEEPTTCTSHHPVWWYDDNPNSPVCRQHPQAGCLAAQCGHPTLWTWHMPSPIRSLLLLSICRKSSLITSFHSELCLPSRPTVPEAFQGKQKQVPLGSDQET